ncbi:MAG TPA: hypothetical protein VHO70_00125 [Chitinispirillaceae bacterium]|nr:hypothetical protein [Chitinispirillaceae bacterium]
MSGFFGTTDPVKFARIIPDTDTTRRFSDEVTNFLESTRPLPQTAENNQESFSSPDGTRSVPPAPESSVNSSITTNEVSK